MQVQISFAEGVSIKTSVENIAQVLSYQDAEVVLKLINFRICESIQSKQNGTYYSIKVLRS
ncbi:MAG: hypothetical protein EBU90_20340 [Proteobacteria bacterium]|nr:hypothetical protein [Pseudomonadota bacterium]